MVSLGWSSPTGEGDADVSVLLLTADGKVRSDADFYFYNNPVAADGSVQLLGKTPTADGNEDRISLRSDRDSGGRRADRRGGEPLRRSPLRGSGRPTGDPGRRRRARGCCGSPSRTPERSSALHLRRALPAGRRLEVPRRRAGVRVRSRGPGHRTSASMSTTTRRRQRRPKWPRRPWRRTSRGDGAPFGGGGRARRDGGRGPRPRPQAAVPSAAVPRPRSGSCGGTDRERARRGPAKPAPGPVRRRRRSRCPRWPRSPSRRTTPGGPPGSSRSPRSRATGTGRPARPPCCCR